MCTLLEDVKRALTDLESAKSKNIYAEFVSKDIASTAHLARIGGLDEAIYRLKHIIKNHEKSSDV